MIASELLTVVLTDGVSSRDRFTVVGAKGFIGSRLAAALTVHGVDVLQPLRGDDDTLWRQPLGHVIYCAGLTADYALRPFDTVEAHVSSFSHLLRACDYRSIVYLSSTRLYDGSPFGAREDAALSLDPRNPRHLYDLSKALGEWLCINASSGRGRVARLSSVYAADLSSDNFLHTLISAALEGGAAGLDTAADLSRDYIDVDDVVALLVAIAARGTRPIYNVASGENTTNRQILDALNAPTGSRLHAASMTPVGTTPSVVNIAAIVEDFDFRPRPVLQRLPQIVAARRLHS